MFLVMLIELCPRILITTCWLVQRSALSVILVALSGWFRYHPPAKVRLSEDEELAEIQRQTKLEAARAAQLGRSLMAAAAGRKAETEGPPDPTLPTGPGSHTAAGADNDSDEESGSDTGSSIVALPVTPSKRPAPRRLTPAARASAEERLRTRAFNRLEKEPDISAKQLAKVLRVRWERADRFIRAYKRQASDLAL
jgi:hypothetical protein